MGDLPVDLQFDQIWGIDHVPTRNSMTAFRITHNRANFLAVERSLAHGSLDRYTYTRDFYSAAAALQGERRTVGAGVRRRL
jgi:phospholipid-binding lipoprotein MlaA